MEDLGRVKEREKMIDLSFYQGKKVLITGHTGFKGSWMCKVLADVGADIIGYALNPPTVPSLFELLGLEKKLHSVEGDIRDLDHLRQVFEQTGPEIVIHMAAQPIVRESYKNPAYTYEVNIMGTVNVLECIRESITVKSFVNVTTDKVYKNREWEWGYRENEELNGFDPYSNSKSCSELVTESYKNSFFGERKTAISTVRAGNVIGGGDFAVDRIIPDCIRAIEKNREIAVRNPYSIRPYQHVLEPVMAYLILAEQQYNNPTLAGSYNIGPEDCDCVTTGALVDAFCKTWNSITEIKVSWSNQATEGPHEANFLRLDCAKAKHVFGWKPVWHMEQAIEKIVEWSVAYLQDNNLEEVMKKQIEEYKRGYGNV